MAIKTYIVNITNDIMPDGFERFEEEYGAEELVRCKDCQFHGKGTCSAYDNAGRPDWWYCADGRKKDE